MKEMEIETDGASGSWKEMEMETEMGSTSCTSPPSVSRTNPPWRRGKRKALDEEVEAPRRGKLENLNPTMAESLADSPMAPAAESWRT